MSRTFEFTVPGEPVVKARPRVYRTHTINTAETIEGENRVLQAFVKKYGYPKPIEGPVRLSCIFYLTNRRRKDFDNLVKLVTDALNGVAFKDDSQVMRATIAKVFPASIRNDDPHTWVKIEEES